MTGGTLDPYYKHPTMYRVLYNRVLGDFGFSICRLPSRNAAAA